MKCSDLAARWPLLPHLTPEEATDFAFDLAAAREALLAVPASALSVR